jgi:8-oxo-dGTP diphosphatase
MSLQEKDVYYVAVKLFLEQNDTFLITKDMFDDGWDLPGGRIKQNEFETPLEKVIERKIQEELGTQVQYKLGSPTVFFRHERTEAETNTRVRIFGIGYRAQYLGGDIQLGDHHNEYSWVSIKTFNPEGYFRGGWKTGVNEYLSVRRTEK